MKIQQIIILLFVQLVCYGQNSDYGDWQTLYKESVGDNIFKVEISFKLSTCGTYGLKGYSRWRTRNDFLKDEQLTFKFDWMDCDNKIHTERMRIDLNKQGIDDYNGNWFLGYSIATPPYDIKINGIPIEQYKSTGRVVDGHLIPIESNEPEKYKRFAKPKVDFKKKDSTFHLSPDVIHRNGTAMGRRADNATPNIQVESEAITVKQASPSRTKKK